MEQDNLKEVDEATEENIPENNTSKILCFKNYLYSIMCNYLIRVPHIDMEIVQPPVEIHPNAQKRTSRGRIVKPSQNSGAGLNSVFNGYAYNRPEDEDFQMCSTCKEYKHCDFYEPIHPNTPDIAAFYTCSNCYKFDEE